LGLAGRGAGGRPGRGRRAGDRFEARDRAFHERVRAGYLQVAAREANVLVVDASRPEAEVQAELQQQVRRWVP
jgi:dTMP kinase